MRIVEFDDGYCGVNFGRTMCPATVDLFDDSNNQVAVAQVNYIILNNLNAA